MKNLKYKVTWNSGKARQVFLDAEQAFAYFKDLVKMGWSDVHLYTTFKKN